MNERDNQAAERAAPCPLCESPQVQICRDSNNPMKDTARCRECKCTAPLATWNRRSPAVGEDGLPPLPEADEYSATRMLPNGELAPRFNGTSMRDYARIAIAADRAARAQQQAQSIDSPEFRELLRIYDSVIPGVDDEEEVTQRLIAHIDAWGRAGRTAEAPAECTQPMLEAAMKAAVTAKMFPPSGSEDAYLRYWYGMKAGINAALAAAPSPQRGKEGCND